MANTHVYIKSRVNNLCDSEANWNLKTEFIPNKGELVIYEPDENYKYPRTKAGDGVTLLKDLPFINIGGGKGNSESIALQVSNTQPSFACTWFKVTSK